MILVNAHFREVGFNSERVQSGSCFFVHSFSCGCKFGDEKWKWHGKRLFTLGDWLLLLIVMIRNKSIILFYFNITYSLNIIDERESIVFLPL